MVQQVMQQRLPAATLANLFPFQRDGVRFIVRSKGRALLADEPGLGKTVQVGMGEGRISRPGQAWLGWAAPGNDGRLYFSAILICNALC